MAAERASALSTAAKRHIVSENLRAGSDCSKINLRGDKAICYVGEMRPERKHNMSALTTKDVRPYGLRPSNEVGNVRAPDSFQREEKEKEMVLLAASGLLVQCKITRTIFGKPTRPHHAQTTAEADGRVTFVSYRS